MSSSLENLKLINLELSVMLYYILLLLQCPHYDAMQFENRHVLTSPCVRWRAYMYTSRVLVFQFNISQKLLVIFIDMCEHHRCDGIWCSLSLSLFLLGYEMGHWEQSRADIIRVNMVQQIQSMAFQERGVKLSEHI